MYNKTHGAQRWRSIGIYVLMIVVYLSGCTTTTPRDYSGTGLTGELATRVVRVQGYAGVEPLNLFVRPGTVVVWVNQYGDAIRIIFPDRKVTIACLSPVNFAVNADGFFESAFVTPGAVASLCFVQPGSYAYIVERQADARRAQSEGLRMEGSIVVR